MGIAINREIWARIFIGINISLFFLLPFAHVQAETPLVVTPAIMNEKAKAREILKASVTLENNLERKVVIYTFVNNIALYEGKQEFRDPSRADLSSSLANWIMFPSASELLPGEKKKIDFDIEVNLRAKPGMYHARISFVEAPTRYDAEARAEGAPSTIVNLEVLEDIKEILELRRFVPAKTFFPRFPVSFTYELANIGNKPLTPRGEIRIYNRGGEEIGSIKINEESETLQANAEMSLASVWKGKDDGAQENAFLAFVSGGLSAIGQYKAFLDLEYGSKQRATVQDTVFFWIFPWKEIFGIFGVISIILIVLATVLHRRRYRDDENFYNERE